MSMPTRSPLRWPSRLARSARWGSFRIDPEAVRKLIRKLGRPETCGSCYEAGPCGYVLYWQLTELGVPCEVVAPRWCP